MKKIFACMIAVVMVTAMGVASFADNVAVFGGSSDAINDTPVSEITFKDVYIFDKDMKVKTDAIVKGEAYENLVAGDILMFPMNGIQPVNGEYKVDKDWRIKVTNSRFVENAGFFYDKNNVIPDESGDVSGSYVMISLSDDFNSYEADCANFEFFVYDKNEPKQKTEVQSVKYKFADYAEIKLDKFDIGVIVPMEENTIYTLADGIKSANVMFDMDGLNIAVRMYEDEEYLVKENSIAYSKKLSVKYKTDVEVITLDSNLDVYDIIFEAKKDNKAIYMVDGDNLLPAEAKYIDRYEMGKDEYTLIKGYLVDNVEDSAWVILDADIEIAVSEPEAEEPTVIPPVIEKPNPSTGADDVVGSVAALVVVSAFGVGALLAKKDDED